VGKEYHPDWLLAKALRSGIGLHHGRLPRALAQEIVRAFNSGELDSLICTSTLIEGVNTRAKNVVIYDNKIAQREYDFFTFNNIKGRSGRMWHHFVGRVFIFHDPPSTDLPVVDIPVFSQAPNVPTSLLIQLDREELTGISWQKVQPYYEQSTLSVETLQANRGVGLDQQLELAERLQEDEALARALAWTTPYPSYERLLTVCKLIWEHMPPTGCSQHGAVSPKQLAYLLQTASLAHGRVRRLIDDMLLGGPTKGKPDESVEAALDFMRYWPGHHLPRRLQAVQLITHDVYGRKGWRAGNYSAYIARAQSLFMEPFFADLEEYGIPAALTRKLRRFLTGYSGLDDLLEKVHVLRDPPGLSSLERRLLRQAQQSL
jgi:hypothetical protein